jgi:hypothetical protein
MSAAPTTGTPDYYADLGVKPTATADDIKAAYRAAAKRAHPDAGGSAEAMQRVNEAHAVLADPLARRDYDRRRAEPKPASAHRPAGAPHHTSPHHAAPPHDAASQTAPHATPDPAAMRREAEVFRRQRIVQARYNALHIIRRSFIAAVLLTIITRYFLTFNLDTPTSTMLKLLGLVPVYGLIVGIVFLLSPQIRLDLFDLMRHLTRRGPNPHLGSADRATLVGLALGFVPLAIIWLTLT